MVWSGPYTVWVHPLYCGHRWYEGHVEYAAFPPYQRQPWHRGITRTPYGPNPKHIWLSHLFWHRFGKINNEPCEGRRPWYRACKYNQLRVYGQPYQKVPQMCQCAICEASVAANPINVGPYSWRHTLCLCTQKCDQYLLYLFQLASSEQWGMRNFYCLNNQLELVR